MTEEQKARVSSITSFIGGEVYNSVAVLYFTNCIDDLHIRSIFHPLVFIVQGDEKNTVFRTNLNPTPEQIPQIRRFIDMAQGRIPYGIEYTPLQKRLPNEGTTNI